MALITKQEVPKKVRGFAQGWLYAFTEYAKENHYEEYDEWSACGKWDLNLTVGEHGIVKIHAYRYKNGEIETQNWATLCSKTLKSVL